MAGELVSERDNSKICGIIDNILIVARKICGWAGIEKTQVIKRKGTAALG